MQSKLDSYHSHLEFIRLFGKFGRVVVDVNDLDIHVDAVLIGPVRVVAVGAVARNHFERNVLLVLDALHKPNLARVGVDGEEAVQIGLVAKAVDDLAVGLGLVDVVGFDNGDYFTNILVAFDHARLNGVGHELGWVDVLFADVYGEYFEFARGRCEQVVAHFGDHVDDHRAGEAIIERVLNLEKACLLSGEGLLVVEKLELEPFGVGLGREKAAQELLFRVGLNEYAKLLENGTCEINERINLKQKIEF